MASGKHILIIGSGVIGLSTAYYAMQMGHRVSIIERASAQNEGCSFGNAGMIVPSHFVPLAAPGMVQLGLKWMWNPESPFYIKPRLSAGLLRWSWLFMRSATAGHVARAAPLIRDLSLASRAAFEEFANNEPEIGLVKKGLLMLCKTKAAWHEEARTAEKATELGIPAQVLDAARTAALDPDITMDIAGSVYFPKDCHLSPDRFLATLKQRLIAGGASFHYDTGVTGWRRRQRKIETILTTTGEFTADEYVLCCGAWSPETVRTLSLDIPMQAGKGYSVTHPHPRQLPALCAIFVEARVAVTPMNGRLRIGGTMEIAGLNEKVDPRRVRGILKAIPQYYPELKSEDFADLPVWHGLRPCAPDGMPYMGRFRAFENLSTATGHAMMGLSLGLITGQIMARILSDEAPGFDMKLLAPDRFA